VRRRHFVSCLSILPVALAVGLGCSSEGDSASSTSADTGDSGTSTTVGAGGLRMPAEDAEHERTWMAWPSSQEVWGEELPEVQVSIARLATAISEYEPVTMLVPPGEVEQAQEALGEDVEIVEAPVDYLWARDTLPNMVVGDDGSLGASHATFNGWGDKQVHDRDAQLAGIVADRLGVPLADSGLVGEGGGIEVDGAGTVMAAESSWVNENRNPGMSRDEIEGRILDMVGGDRMIWVDGLAGADITDGHIDTLARFVDEDTILVEKPVGPPDDPWVRAAERTREQLAEATTRDGHPYEIVEIQQPAETRGQGEDYLSSYLNYYVVNGAVIAPEFGDTEADEAARTVLAGLYPDREIVMIDIDAIAEGGGGIHCSTQQQPRVVQTSAEG
jgi:agmatine deiminase